jgi:hypothetical protein
MGANIKALKEWVWMECKLQFLILCGTGFEVLTVAVIHYAFWVRTTYGLVHIYECPGGPFWFCLPRPPEDTGIMSSPKPEYPQILHCTIILKTKHSNLNILLFPCIVFPFITNQRNVRIRKKKCALLLYITFPCEQKQVGAMLRTQVRYIAE